LFSALFFATDYTDYTDFQGWEITLFKSASIRSAIRENCAFLAKLSEASFPITNDKFSIANFQFRLGALVAAMPRCVHPRFLPTIAV
jgi:hypothetical protein